MSELLKLRVTTSAEKALRAGHPWLFADRVREENRPGRLGELAIIYDRHDSFLAIGLYDPHSPIRVRVLHAGKPAKLDAAWWGKHLEEAMTRRSGLFGPETNGYRLLNGESDGWPGLVLDRYESNLVLKVYTAAWLPRLDELQRLFLSRLEPARLILRLSRNIQENALAHFARRDGEILFGPALEGSAVFLENGLRFESDLVRGQKTGFFLDQRENRKRVGELARGASMLNVFSFSGGFSLYSARGGARTAADLDISSHALEAAHRNFSLNRGVPEVAACRHETIKADAFDWLNGKPGRQFDLIVLDPPSLAKRESEAPGALLAYARLAEGSAALLKRTGILVACSCSAHVPAAEFFAAVRQAVGRSGRKMTEIGVSHHAPDHPATIPEMEYLKAIYLRG